MCCVRTLCERRIHTPYKEGMLWKGGKNAERKEEEEGRETGATWGPVNRLVLNSNNVENSKHFSQSKRKPQSLGCLCCAVAAGLCSTGLTGGQWAGWHRRATGSRAGAETQTNTASPARRLELRDKNSGPNLGPASTRISGVCCWWLWCISSVMFVCVRAVAALLLRHVSGTLKDAHGERINIKQQYTDASLCRVSICGLKVFLNQWMVLAPLNPNKISSFMQRQERGCARSNRWWMQALCRLASYSAFLPLLNDSCVLWWQKNNADNSVRFQSHGDSLKYCGWSRHMWRSKKKGKKSSFTDKADGFLLSI